ncbi:MAG: serine acetyltransferase [Proteobacteria bacterium]|nr:serine acetyltransferase [Pseudomonadota bacterium]
MTRVPQPATNGGVALDLAAVVEELCGNASPMTHRWLEDRQLDPLPSRDVVVRISELLRIVLFPGYFGSSELRAETVRYHVGHTLDDIQRTLAVQIQRSLAFAESDAAAQTSEHEARARSITTAFVGALPCIQELLATDVRAAFEGDPAARSPDETIFCYPGVLAVTHYRVAHELHRLGVPLLPRMITEHAHSVTGIDIHPGATIGAGFFIDHGTGVVIGETSVIGNGVRIYQGVTLGARSFPLDATGSPVKGIPRHPIIEDGVVIYSGATVLGRVTIGSGSVIGGNVWLTVSVPAGSRITSAPPRQDVFASGGGI